MCSTITGLCLHVMLIRLVIRDPADAADWCLLVWPALNISSSVHVLRMKIYMHLTGSEADDDHLCSRFHAQDLRNLDVLSSSWLCLPCSSVHFSSPMDAHSSELLQMSDMVAPENTHMSL